MPTESSISKKLKLAAKTSNRSAASRLYDIIEDVESAITSGVRHDDIVAILNSDNFNFTLESFRNTLKYVRKKTKGESPKFNIEKPIKQNKPPIKTSQNLVKKEGKKSIDLKALSKIGASTK
mgnify:CR=1 FL=1